MPPAQDHVIVPFLSPQREISPAFTPMPSFSGYLKRTSGIQEMLLTTLYIVTVIAVWTSTWTRQDTQVAGIPCHFTCIVHNIPTTATQSTAADWLRVNQERQLETDIHGHPVHMPVTATTFTSLRCRNCTPRVGIHQKHYGTMPHTYFPSTKHPTAQRTTTTTGLTQDRIQYDHIYMTSHTSQTDTRLADLTFLNTQETTRIYATINPRNKIDPHVKREETESR